MGFTSFIPAYMCLLIAVLTVNTTNVTSTTIHQCDQIVPVTEGKNICVQKCPQGGCQLNCRSDDSFESCFQKCSGGNCDLYCSAYDTCAMRCHTGNCNYMLCTARRCGMECPVGGCEMNCRAEVWPSRLQWR